MKSAATYLAALIVLALPSFALAQAQRLAGTIVSVDGPTVMLKTAKGENIKVSLAEKGTVLAVEKVTIDGIKKGEFVGVGAMPQADGTQRAVRINIFDEARRGNNEGHRPGWGPDSKGTMTNATVDTTVSSVEGRVLTLKYKDGEKKIIVPPEAVIQRNVPGNTSDLKPGAAVTISAATPKGEGVYETARINVGRDGYVPE
ncbi:MAG TPA: hypothetical protein VHK44_00545 [Xanthobacteraceae bacterium]|nr:hypothetical protein [Xanthobacteraceae bacterium]